VIHHFASRVVGGLWVRSGKIKCGVFVAASA